ncbi:MAG: 4Fe-4S dicluster domain-containing protein [Bacteroidetes bacterium]|nr:4Fe-4S dicluster domain-containing protein [Bacteroidota bacterium]
MAYIISKLCRDCLDISCTQVCPVDCIYQYKGDDPTIPNNQLLIDPDECINCNACVPECPWEAIYEEDLLPEVFTEDLEINARIVGKPRIVPKRPDDQKLPSQEEVQSNKEKWGYKDF